LEQFRAENFLASVLVEKHKFRADGFSIGTHLYKDEIWVLTSSYYIEFNLPDDVRRFTNTTELMETIMILLCNIDALNLKDAFTCAQQPISYRHYLTSGRFYVSDKVMELTDHDGAIRLYVHDPFFRETLLLIGIPLQCDSFLFIFSGNSSTFLLTFRPYNRLSSRRRYYYWGLISPQILSLEVADFAEKDLLVIYGVYFSF
jgi:hypothetical protein